MIRITFFISENHFLTFIEENLTILKNKFVEDQENNDDDDEEEDYNDLEDDAEADESEG